MARVNAMREARGWSTRTLAQKMTEAGCPSDQSSQWRSAYGLPRRRVPLDEFAAYVVVFGVTPDELLSEEPLRITQEFA